MQFLDQLRLKRCKSTLSCLSQTDSPWKDSRRAGDSGGNTEFTSEGCGSIEGSQEETLKTRICKWLIKDPADFWESEWHEDNRRNKRADETLSEAGVHLNPINWAES